MDYDPIKDRLGQAFGRSPLLHRTFFKTLDLVFLRAWYVHRVLRKLLDRLPSSRVRVLDAGTGFGQYSYWLLRADPRVRITAVDVKEDYLARASQLFDDVGLADRIEFRHHDLTVPLPESSTFDLIVSVDVMEHIEDDIRVFRNMTAALRPGGYLVVNTPSDQGGSDAGTSDGSFIGEHVREGYSPDELTSKLKSAGLEVVEWTYTYGWPGSLGWRLLVKHPIRLLGRSWGFLPLLLPYYLLTAPVALGLNALDLRVEKPTGTGLLMVARRPE
jgi:2-polyprenyl-3-methyl-5-hydroxy-6-metoxy-1,4-benzoquinol methylase